MSDPQILVGSDVAKAQLEIALRPTGERWSLPNDDTGSAARVTRLERRPLTRVVLEATGGFQRAVVAALAAAGLPVVVVNPRPARDFAKAPGPLAKTDGLDARALAHVAEAVRPTPRPLPDAQTDELRALVTRRRQLVAIRTAEVNRLGRAPRRVQADLQAHIAWLDQRLAARDDDLDTALRASPLWRARDAVPPCPRPWPRMCAHARAGVARVGHPEPPADRSLGWGGALQPGSWDPARPPHELGRSRRGARHAGDEHPGGRAL